MVRNLIDCKNKTQSVKTVAIYDINGNIIDNDEVPEYAIKWYSIVPETVGDIYYHLICTP